MAAAAAMVVEHFIEPLLLLSAREPPGRAPVAPTDHPARSIPRTWIEAISTSAGDDQDGSGHLLRCVWPTVPASARSSAWYDAPGMASGSVTCHYATHVGSMGARRTGTGSAGPGDETGTPAIGSAGITAVPLVVPLDARARGVVVG